MRQRLLQIAGCRLVRVEPAPRCASLARGLIASVEKHKTRRHLHRRLRRLRKCFSIGEIVTPSRLPRSRAGCPCQPVGDFPPGGGGPKRAGRSVKRLERIDFAGADIGQCVQLPKAARSVILRQWRTKMISGTDTIVEAGKRGCASASIQPCKHRLADRKNHGMSARVILGLSWQRGLRPAIKCFCNQERTSARGIAAMIELPKPAAIVRSIVR